MDKAKIKVLFLFVNLNVGETETGLLRVLKNINKNKFDCSVVSIEKKGPIGEEIERLGFTVIYLNSKARLFNLFLITKIVKILAYQKPDILHTCLFHANFFGRLASLFHKPLVTVADKSRFMPNHYTERLEDLYLKLVKSGRIQKDEDYSKKQHNGPPDTIYPMW